MKKWFRILFWTYMIFLIVVVIFKFNGSLSELTARAAQVKVNRAAGYWNYNLQPFKTIRLYLGQISHGYAVQNLIANVLAFVPLGFLLPVVQRACRRPVGILFRSLLFLILVEGLQYITMLGSLDVDDIILNMAGIVVGYVICRKVFPRLFRRKKHGKKQNAQNTADAEEDLRIGA